MSVNRHSNLDISPASQTADGTIGVALDVTNTGTRAGDEIVQLYISDDVTSVVYYETVLRGFERVALKAGETRRIQFQLGPRDLMLIDSELLLRVEPRS